jgi:hypothetical protein
MNKSSEKATEGMREWKKEKKEEQYTTRRALSNHIEENEKRFAKIFN